MTSRFSAFARLLLGGLFVVGAIAFPVPTDRPVLARVEFTIIEDLLSCGVGAVGGQCPLNSLTHPPFTDADATALENAARQGEHLIVWPTANPSLQQEFNRLRAALPQGASATVNSAYRPLQYQQHFIEIANRWCASGLSDPQSQNSRLAQLLGQRFLKRSVGMASAAWSAREATLPAATARMSAVLPSTSH